jgi:hypothetical protein
LVIVLGAPAFVIAGEVELPVSKSPAGEDIGKPSSAGSRLAAIGSQMREVETLLRGNDLTQGTRQRQERIASELARMIEEQKKQSNGSNSQPGNPDGAPSASAGRAADDARAAQAARTGNPPEGPGEAARWSQSLWGALPDQVRQRVQEMGNEDFLPAFADVIREYYRQLAERGSKQP